MVTYAPDTIKALAAYWVGQGGVNLGIVGDTAHQELGTSYHLGQDDLAPGAYSAILPRDVAGLSRAASALDIGRLNGSLSRLYRFSEWLVSRCQDRAPVTGDVREVIWWSVANQRVQRWNYDNVVRWGEGQGDISHKTHTHISFFRDSEYRAKVDLFRPYFEGDTVNAFSVFEKPMLARLKAGTWLYYNSGLQTNGENVQLTGRTGDQLLLPYVGTLSSEVRIVAYEALAPDANVSSRAMFVKATDIVELVAAPAPKPVDPNPALVAQVASLTKERNALQTKIAAIRTVLA